MMARRYIAALFLNYRPNSRLRSRHTHPCLPLTSAPLSIRLIDELYDAGDFAVVFRPSEWRVVDLRAFVVIFWRLNLPNPIRGEGVHQL